MRTKQITGGLFVPLISIPTMENVSYLFCNKKSDIIIVLVLAIMSFILAIEKKFKALWFTGIVSLCLTIAAFINFRILRPHIAGIQFEWGWALLIIGPALMVVSAAMESFKEYIT